MVQKHGIKYNCSLELNKGQNVIIAMKTYEELNEMVLELGEIYGLHVVIEMVVMMTCICVNLFFVISQFQWTFGMGVYGAVILPYFVWFHWICSCGHGLRSEGYKCFRSLKRLGHIKSTPVSFVCVYTMKNEGIHI
jgi:hypothetical protein